MYDISINKNGGIILYEGDLQPANFERYISQRIHAAIMNIPPDMLSGGSTKNKNTMVRIFNQYFYDYFSSDKYIDPNGLTVINKSLNDDDTIASYEIQFQGESPEGRIINYRSNFDFNMSGGVISGLDYKRRSYGVNTREIIEINDIVIVDTPTDKIELPVSPYKGLDSDKIIGPIAIIDMEYSEDDDISANFTIEVTEDKKTYQLENYIENIEFDKHIISVLDNIEVNPDTAEVSLFNRGGKIIVRADDPCTITGSVTLSSAKHLTYDILYSDTHIENIVFPLRPIGGKCYAVFPTTIMPGKYIMRYSGEK